MEKSWLAVGHSEIYNAVIPFLPVNFHLIFRLQNIDIRNSNEAKVFWSTTSQSELTPII